MQQVTEAILTSTSWCRVGSSRRVFRWEFSPGGGFTIRVYAAQGDPDRYPLGKSYGGSWALSDKIDLTEERIVELTIGSKATSPQNYLSHLEGDHLSLKFVNGPVHNTFKAIRCTADSIPEYDKLPPSEPE
jgi:hypothetical protein